MVHPYWFCRKNAYCGIKRITKPMMGFKKFHSAEATSGTELHRMLKNEQHIHSNNASIFEQFYSLAA
jgi:putative transposase